ncbi:uncharacterized protein LOC112350724 [Selaginella moellendorffii]|uniref:uncharacterized protein LOC112350724 n=1 Tax=Selaginella moellendorffii TaxID=88036 RepID=UPI000D1C5802|nr:uncharacterized protein LOC112350724 [Selaginella moellendorffii]|eukprot:XP_024543215.1 uncharacterized protein LOC112350724 [Selaginella moellendorffii]
MWALLKIHSGVFSPVRIFYAGASRAVRRHAQPASAVLIDPLVSSAWLEKNLYNVSILDVRGIVDTKTLSKGVEKSDYIACYDDYLSGHIPGAVFFNWLTDGIDISQSEVSCRQLTNDTAKFSAVVEAKGVSSEKPVVVYDDCDCLLACWLWWSLVRHGHERVHVLDGGYKKWTAEGRATELYEPCPLKIYGDFKPSNPRPFTSVTCDEILELLSTKDQSIAFVDARNLEQYSGHVRRSKRAGRIPGAISIPRKSLITTNGIFKTIDELREVFLNAGLNPAQQKRLIFYCNGGVASCSVLLSWHRIGGKLWSNYSGSWNEWGNREDVPVES